MTNWTLDISRDQGKTWITTSPARISGDNCKAHARKAFVKGGPALFRIYANGRLHYVGEPNGWRIKWSPGDGSERVRT